MAATSGLGRTPSYEMTAEDLVAIVRALEAAGIAVWLDGGWAVDAVLGEQTRRHDDLDVVVELQHVERLQAILAERGFVLASGGPPGSFELVDADGRQVDVHPVRLDDHGNGLYRMESGEDWLYPAVGFTGRGVIAGTRVRCLTPEVQMLCHSGYEPHRASYDDIWALSGRFGIPVPEEYRRPRETYPCRSA